MMKTNFNISHSTSIEQSERLLKLGLKPETADCYWWQETDQYGDGNGKFHLELLTAHTIEHWEYLYKHFGVCLADDEEHYFIPAWTVGRLIEIMPIDAVPDGGFDNIFTFIKNYPDGYSIEYDGFSYYYKNNIYDTFIDGIEHLIDEGYFNKEYLNERIHDEL